MPLQEVSAVLLTILPVAGPVHSLPCKTGSADCGPGKSYGDSL